MGGKSGWEDRGNMGGQTIMEGDRYMGDVGDWRDRGDIGTWETQETENI